MKQICIALALLTIFLAACSPAASTQLPGLPAYSEADKSAPPEAPEAGGFAADTASNRSTTGQQGVERLVIKTASLSIVVADPGTGMEDIARMADAMGGFVVSSNVYKTQTERGIEVPQAAITVRVPAERLTEALTLIRDLVENPLEDILSDNVSGEDVTQQYTDLQSRLRNLEQAEEQLREIMASATRPEDVLNIFNQLTSVRGEIEVLKGQIQYYEEAAALSSVSVTLVAQEAVAPLSIGGWQPVGVARNAVQALINTLQFLGNAAIWLIIYVLPVFIVIFIPLRLIWIGIRKWRASRRARRAAPPAATPPAATT
jgi:hypothetical protein